MYSVVSASWRGVGRAFSLLEVMIVVIVLGILAGVVVPRFAGVESEARTAALQAALGGVRSGIASYRTRALIAGEEPFPAIEELLSAGTVVQGDLPVNPFNELRTVQWVSAAQAASRFVSGSDQYGWNYSMDNSTDPPTVAFYANSTDATTVSDGSGGVLDANEL